MSASAPGPAEGDPGGEGVLARLREIARRVAWVHEGMYMAPWRSGLEREANKQRDLLTTLVFLEALGVENPASYHALELYPEMVVAYHEWHRRQGLERAPEGGFCC